jgi:hypothetical protein
MAAAKIHRSQRLSVASDVARLRILRFFHPGSTFVTSWVRRIPAAVVIAQQTRSLAVAAGAMVQPYFSYFFVSQSDFGQSARSASMSISKLALSFRTSSKTRIVARLAAVAVACSQDIRTG